MLLIRITSEELKIIFVIDISFVSDISEHIDALSIDANYSFKQQIAIKSASNTIDKYRTSV